MPVIHRTRQRGAVAVGVALLLLIMITLVTLSSVQVAVGEQRSMASDVQAQVLGGLAELALARGIAHLRFNLARLAAESGGGWMTPGAVRWSACSAARIEPPCGDGISNRYGSDWTAYADVGEARHDTAAGNARVHYLARAAVAGSAVPRAELVQIVGESRSLDGRSHALIRQDALVQPLLASFPEASVIAASAAVGGNGRIVAAAVLSIWTAADTRLSAAALTCRAPDTAGAICGDTLSNAASENSDVLDVDGGQGANLDSAVSPGDIFERLFGLGSAAWPSVRDSMHAVDDCSALSAVSAGAYWIDGDCTLAENASVGSPAAPVILVVANGRLIAPGSSVYGLVLLFTHDGGEAGIAPTAGATIVGALAANAALDIGGNYRVRYDSAVASALLKGPAAALQLTPVPGGWRDY